MFDGSVSLIGHSLGSLILFDLLDHQPYPNSTETSQQQQQQQSQLKQVSNQQITDIDKFLTDLGLSDLIETFKKEKIDEKSLV